MKLSVIGFLSGALLVVSACTSEEKPMSRDLTDLPVTSWSRSTLW